MKRIVLVTPVLSRGKRTRKMMTGLNISHFAAITVLLSVFLSGCGKVGPSPAADEVPFVVEGEEIAKWAKRLSERAELSYSGLAFFRGKLYAGTNFGVLEIDEQGGSRLFKWKSYDDVVSEPWADEPGGAIWFLHHGRGDLVRFDGAKWSRAALPGEDEMTRADMLGGVRGFSSSTDFWLQSTKGAWRWDGARRSWLRLMMPSFDCSFDLLDPEDSSQNQGCFAAILPVENHIYVVAHSRYVSRAEPIANFSAKLESDRVYRLADGKLSKLEIPDQHFIIDERQIFPANEGVYAGLHSGRILYVSTDTVSVIELPGKLLTFTLNSNGNLIAAIEGQGIFERTDRWEKRSELPTDVSKEDYFFYLAGDEQKLAFAISPKRSTVGASRSRLWISDHGNFIEYRR